MTDLLQQQINHLIKLGAEQFTGGDVAAFLRLATGEEDRLLDRIKEEGESLPLVPEKDPPISLLWEKAHLAGFADVFADVKASEKNVTDLQAFFCGWYHLWNRPNGRAILRQADLPKTITEMAAFLNRTRAILYKWMAADWFKNLSVQSWLDRQIIGILPGALYRLEQNIKEGNGPVSNQAIKIVVDEARTIGGRTTPAVQVNVQNNQQVNIDEYRDSPLDLLRSRLNSLAAAEQARLGAGGADG